MWVAWLHHVREGFSLYLQCELLGYIMWEKVSLSTYNVSCLVISCERRFLSLLTMWVAWLYHVREGFSLYLQCELLGYIMWEKVSLSTYNVSCLVISCVRRFLSLLTMWVAWLHHVREGFSLYLQCELLGYIMWENVSLSTNNVSCLVISCERRFLSLLTMWVAWLHHVREDFSLYLQCELLGYIMWEKVSLSAYNVSCLVISCERKFLSLLTMWVARLYHVREGFSLYLQCELFGYIMWEKVSLSTYNVSCLVISCVRRFLSLLTMWVAWLHHVREGFSLYLQCELLGYIMWEKISLSTYNVSC